MATFHNNPRVAAPTDDRRSVVSYTRYSSDQQDERSIRDQQRRCRERAERDGLTIDEEYADEAISGARRDRPNFLRLCDDCRTGKIKIVFIESLSRLSRDALLSQKTLLELVHRHQVRFVAFDDGIDTDNESWSLLSGIHGYQSEQYLKTLAKQVHRGQTGIVLEGLSVGDLRFGYSSVPVDGPTGRTARNAKPKMRYVINQEQADWVRWVFERFVRDGWSHKRIAAELIRQGVPRDNRARSNRWTPDTIVKLLRCAKYMGVWTWGVKKNQKDPLTGQIKQVDRPEGSPDVHRREIPELAIIDAATFAAAQRLLDESKDRYRRHRDENGHLNGSPRSPKSSEARYVLSGLIECAECGRRMVAFGTNSEYFKCKNNIDGNCGCSTQLPRQLAERLVLGKVAELLFGEPQAVDRLFAAVQDGIARIERQSNDTSRLESEIDAIQGKINHLLDLAEGGDPDAGDRLAQRQEEKRELVGRLAELRSAKPDVPLPLNRDWVERKLHELQTVLSGDAALANPLLAALLVDGKVVVREVDQEGKQRKTLVGEFALDRAAPATRLLGVPSAQSPLEPTETIRIDFRPPPAPYEMYSDQVAELVHVGVRFKEVAQRLGIGNALVRRAWDHWHAKQGLPTPDGRGGPFRKKDPSEVILRRREEVVRRFQGGQLFAEIADAIGCNPCTVKKDLADWHAENGLPMPDGRHRRKGLERKARPAADPSSEAA